MNIKNLRICGLIYLAILILAGIWGFRTIGRVGMDFTNTTIIEAEIESDYLNDIIGIEKMVKETINSKDVLVQKLSSNRIALRTRELNTEEMTAVINKLDEQYLVPMRAAAEKAKAEEEAKKAAEEGGNYAAVVDEEVQTLENAGDVVTNPEVVAEPVQDTVDEKTGLLTSVLAKVADIRTVGPNQSLMNIFRHSLLIAIVAVLIIFVYMWFRFKVLTSGAVLGTAIIEVLLALCVTSFSIMLSGAATGYNAVVVSITSVIYGLISLFTICEVLRTNCLSVAKKTSWKNLINKTVKDLMPRSISTIITFAAFAIIIYWAAWFYKVTTISEYILPLVISIVLTEIGTITVAFPLLNNWSNGEDIEKTKTVKK